MMKDKPVMKISCCWLYAISTYGYPVAIDAIPEAFQKMADLGFRYVELEGASEGGNLLELSERRAEIKTVADELGLTVVNFCPVIPEIVSLDATVREKGYALFDVALDLAQYFGCSTIQIDSYTPALEFIGDQPYKEMLDYGLDFRVKVDPQFSWDEQWAVLVETFKHCAERARAFGLPFCLEPRVGEIISNTDALLRLMDFVDDDNFGAVLDTAHQHAQKEILPLSVEKLGERIMYLHVADNDGRVNEHKALGEGTVDWDGVFSALAKYNFGGYVAIDIGRLPDMDAAMRRSLEYLSRLLGRLGIAYEL